MAKEPKKKWKKEERLDSWAVREEEEPAQLVTDQLREQLIRERIEVSYAPNGAPKVLETFLDGVLKLEPEQQRIVFNNMAKGGKLTREEKIKILKDHIRRLPTERNIDRTMMRDFMYGIFKLPEELKMRVYEELARRAPCIVRYLDWCRSHGAPHPKRVGFDRAVAWLKSQEHTPWSHTIEVAGDTVYCRERIGQSYGRCLCVLVNTGIVEPTPEMCRCQALQSKTYYEYLFGLQCEGGLVESLNMGGRSCTYRCSFRPILQKAPWSPRYIDWGDDVVRAL